MKRAVLLITLSSLGSLAVLAQAGPGGAAAAGTTGAHAQASSSGPTIPAAGVHAGVQAAPTGPSTITGPGSASGGSSGTMPINPQHPGGPTGPGFSMPNYSSPPSPAGTNAPGTGVRTN